MRSLPFLAILWTACGGSGSVPPGDDDVTPDAELPTDPVDVQVTVFDPPATVWIDGLEGAVRDLHYDDFEDLPDSIEVTLRAGELTIDREEVPLRIAVDDCTFGMEEPQIPSALEVRLCGRANGELRFESTEIVFPTSPCIHDGFCLPACEPTLDGFCPDDKCSSSFASVDRAWSRLECVPAGPRQVGESCAWALGASARYIDDCARGAVCVEDVCRAICTDVGACGGGEVCATPPGHAIELTACLPGP